MAAKVPSAEEIRKILEERKISANKLEVELRNKDGELGKRDEKVAGLEMEVTRLMEELGRARTNQRGGLGEMRGKFAELVEKHRCEPADELMKMLMEKVPILDNQGNQRFNEDGAPMMRDRMDEELRANVLLKLMEFRMPKLRSSESAGQMDIDMKVVIVRFGEHVASETMRGAKVIDA